MKKVSLFILGLTYFVAGIAQIPKDSAKSKELKEVFIKSWQRRDITRLPDEENGFLNNGKKLK